MNSLKNSIEELLQEFFDNKTADADIPTHTQNSIQEMVDNLKADVLDLIETCNTDVDNAIEDVSRDGIERIKDDLRSQDEMEADV